MCGRFIMIPKEILDEIIQEVEVERVPNPMPDWPAVRQSVYPGAQAPIIAPGANGLTSSVKQWGYEVNWKKGVVFNTRVDSAMKPEGFSMWRESIEQRRCVIPTLGFFEPHKTETFINPTSGKPNKQQYLFTLASSPITFIAGIYEGDRFSVITTEPTETVKPIHDRMPVVLKQEELPLWFSDDYPSLFDRARIDLTASKELTANN